MDRKAIDELAGLIAGNYELSSGGYIYRKSKIADMLAAALSQPAKPLPDCEGLAERIRNLPYPYALADNDHFRRVWSVACDAAARELEKATPPPAGEQGDESCSHIWNYTGPIGTLPYCNKCKTSKATMPPPAGERGERVTVSHKPCDDADCTYCGGTPLALARREIVILRRQKSLLHDATIALRNGMGGHKHWDDTMQHGAGCSVCQQQSEARKEATKLIDQCSQMQKEIAELHLPNDDSPPEPASQPDESWFERLTSGKLAVEQAGGKKDTPETIAARYMTVADSDVLVPPLAGAIRDLLRTATAELTAEIAQLKAALQSKGNK